MVRKVLIAGAVLLLGASLVGATTLVKMNFGDLARDADRVVVGTVTDVTGEWDPSLTFIRSNVTLAVERSYRGQPVGQLVLRTPGGYVGGTGQQAEGMATFEVGEKVFVFLTEWDDGTPKVLGYIQGKSRIVVDGQGRERLVGGSADGMLVSNAARELQHGRTHNIPLRPAN